jgi:hypothetical protein
MVTRLKKRNGLLIIVIAVISLTIQSFTVNHTKMKIKEAQSAPGFTKKVQAKHYKVYFTAELVKPKKASNYLRRQLNKMGMAIE